MVHALQPPALGDPLRSVVQLDPADPGARVHVLDGIYRDPDALRARMLASPFDHRGPFPGLRTRTFATPPALRDLLAELAGDAMRYWPATYDNGAFQLTRAGDSASLFIHADPQWIALIYLTPRPPPRSGTSFYRHRATGAAHRPAPELEARCIADGPHEDRWIELAAVDNVYNRMVVFKGDYYHRPTRFFGATPADGRVFQTFFFCTHGHGDCSSAERIDAG